MNSIDHRPLDIFNCAKDRRDFAVIVLNSPLHNDLTTLRYLWHAASYRVTVDGGTDLMHNLLINGEVHKNMDLITGDFDSVNADVLEHYRSIDVETIYTPNQDETDFTKCLRIVLDRCGSKLLHTVEHIVVYGEQAGRFDHIMANVNTLYKFASSSPPPPSPPHTAAAAADILKRAPPHIYLYAHDSCTFALQADVKHRIHVDNRIRGDYCGILPIGNKCKVTTEGFKWDMTNCDTAFGALVSSSNAFLSDTLVTVMANQALIFTMDLRTNRIPDS